MKLFSVKAELKAIRSITTSSEGVAALLLSTFDKSYFHFEPTLAAYNRIVSIARKRGEVVKFLDLVEDPSLNEDFRDVLRESKTAYCKSERTAHELVELLDKYRKARILYEMAKDIITNLKSPEADVDHMMDTASVRLLAGRSGDQLAQQMRILGKDANALDLVDQALDTSVDIQYRTGFQEYDAKSGGLPTDGVMLLAGTTSGGKSAVLLNLLTNVYKLNRVSTCNVSLEMSDKKQTRRLLSHLTKIPFEKFTKQTLNNEDRKLARKMFKKLNAYGDKHGCRYALLNPTHSVTIDQLLMLVKPFGFQVIGIDYASLLDTSGEKDQWKALGEIARRAKIFATSNKCLVVLLCQLDSADDHIRYSQALLEHADVAWIWNYSKPEQRETKVIPIQQKKVRDGELYNFDLQEEFEIMTVSNTVGSSESSADSDAEVASNDQKPDIDFDEDAGAA